MSMEADVLPMTVEEIVGTLHDTDPDSAMTGCAQYDLRLMEPGGRFVSFQGRRVDGHNLAGRAMTGAERTHVGGTASDVADSRPPRVELRSAAADADVRNLIRLGNADAPSAVARGVEAEQMPDAPAALELVRRRWAAGDVLLVKGSHALGLQSPAQQLVMDGATHDHANAKRMGK